MARQDASAGRTRRDLETAEEMSEPRERDHNAEDREQEVVLTLAKSTVAPVAMPIAPAAIASRRRGPPCRHHARA